MVSPVISLLRVTQNSKRALLCGRKDCSPWDGHNAREWRGKSLALSLPFGRLFPLSELHDWTFCSLSITPLGWWPFLLPLEKILNRNCSNITYPLATLGVHWRVSLGKPLCSGVLEWTCRAELNLLSCRCHLLFTLPLNPWQALLCSAPMNLTAVVAQVKPYSIFLLPSHSVNIITDRGISFSLRNSCF